MMKLGDRVFAQWHRNIDAIGEIVEITGKDATVRYTNGWGLITYFIKDLRREEEK